MIFAGSDGIEWIDQHIDSVRIPASEDSMLRIVLLVVIVLALVILAPRLLSRSVAPAVGSPAPDFTLPNQDGSLVSLRDYRGKWVVLYFYPKDQTPG